MDGSDRELHSALSFDMISAPDCHSLDHDTPLSYVPAVLQTEVQVHHILTLLVRVFDHNKSTPP